MRVIIINIFLWVNDKYFRMYEEAINEEESKRKLKMALSDDVVTVILYNLFHLLLVNND